MQLYSLAKKSTLSLVLAGMVLMTPASAHAVSPKTVALSSTALIAALSLYVYKTNPKTENPNRYNLDTLKKALTDVAAGRDVAKNLATIRTQLYYLYVDGVCGHAGKEGSPRLNEKTGLHELPCMPSRGVMGWMHDRINPLKDTLEFAKSSIEFAVLTKLGYEMWFKVATQPLQKTMAIINTQVKAKEIKA